MIMLAALTMSSSRFHLLKSQSTMKIKARQTYHDTVTVKSSLNKIKPGAERDGRGNRRVPIQGLAIGLQWHLYKL